MAESSRLSYYDCTVDHVDIPDNITEVVFWGVRFATAPTIPSTVKKLVIDTCNILDDTPLLLPEGLEDLQLGFQSIYPQKFPLTLKSLYIRKMFFTQLPQIPDELSKLKLYKVRLTNEPHAWPSQLQVLILEECNWKSYPKLPSGLRFLSTNDIHISQFSQEFVSSIPVGCEVEEGI